VIDLHCHILPGVDDGARTIEDSVAMARMAEAAGTKTIVATPHMVHPQFHVPGPLARTKLAEVRAALAAAGVAVEVVLAGEIHWFEDVEGGLASGELLPLSEPPRRGIFATREDPLGGGPEARGETRKYILFELPSTHVPGPFRDLCWKLQLAGIFPVLAHPERNAGLAEDDDALRALRDAGVPVQITAMSLTGAFGRGPRKVSERWLAAGLVDLVASDGHSCRTRPPVLDEAARAIRKMAGPTAEDWLLREVPRRLLAGEPVLG